MCRQTRLESLTIKQIRKLEETKRDNWKISEKETMGLGVRFSEVSYLRVESSGIQIQQL